MRFFAALQELTHATAARLTQIDYDREMALVLAEHGQAGAAELFGIGRIVADPDNSQAEFSLTVRDDVAGEGIGTLLLQRIIDYARQRGAGEIFGHIMSENRTMLEMCGRFGFRVEDGPDWPEITVVRLTL
jgi:acetyltransferase